MIEFPKFILSCKNGIGRITMLQFSNMMNWVSAHKCNNRKIISKDDAFNRTIGFHCLGCGECKSAKLLGIKFEFSHCPELKKFIISQESRVKFASDCNADIKEIN